jgi:hypothetical protein
MELPQSVPTKFQFSDADTVPLSALGATDQERITQIEESYNKRLEEAEAKVKLIKSTIYQTLLQTDLRLGQAKEMLLDMQKKYDAIALERDQLSFENSRLKLMILSCSGERT